MRLQTFAKSLVVASSPGSCTWHLGLRTMDRSGSWRWLQCLWRRPGQNLQEAGAEVSPRQVRPASGGLVVDGDGWFMAGSWLGNCLCTGHDGHDWVVELENLTWSQHPQLRKLRRTIPQLKTSRESLRPGLRIWNLNIDWTKQDQTLHFFGVPMGSMLRICCDFARQFESKSVEILYQVKRWGKISIAKWILWSHLFPSVSHFSAAPGENLQHQAFRNLSKRKS